MSEGPGDRFGDIVGEVLRRAAAEEEAGVDWTGLRARVIGWRSKGAVVFGVVSAFVILASLEDWLGRIARPSETGPRSPLVPLGLLLNVAAVGLVSWHLWRRWRAIRDATSPRYLNHLYRQDLAGRIRSARAMFWGSAPICLLAIFGVFGPAFSFEALAWRALYAVLLSAILWERFVELPRLEREEEDLPFFDDFPHLF